MRDTYDPAKMYWASNQVMSLSQGYFNVMYPLVSEAVRKAEADSLQLVKSSRGLSGEAFAEKLNGNALKVFSEWKELYIQLLKKYNGGAGVRYAKEPQADTPEKY